MKRMTWILIVLSLLMVSWITPVADAKETRELPVLHQAVLQSKIELVRKLLVDVKVHNPNERDVFGTTPLHLAVRADQVAMVKLLLKHGADGNIIDGRGQNAIDQARSWSVWWMLFRSGTLPGMDTTLFLIAITLLVVLALSVWLRKVKTESALSKLHDDAQASDTFRDAA